MRIWKEYQGSAVCGFRPRIFQKAGGFTLLELLIVVTVIGILMTMLIPAFSKVRNAALEKRAEIEKTVIGSAIAAYRLQERGRFPAPKGIYWDGAGADDNNRLVVNELITAGVLDENKLRFNSDGDVLNPWENQYKITLVGGNTNFTDQSSAFYTEVIYSGMP